MGLGNTAKLLASLDLDISRFSKNSKAAMAQLGNMETRVGRIGGLAQQGAASAIGNIARIGAVAAVGITAAVKTGIDDLARLEDATTAVDGAIETMGLTGQVTSKQVATWANDIERNVQAAFDDKEIVAGTANLLRFGKLTPENLEPAMVVMTDLAAKTGDVGGAAELLGKALADPTKAAGKLSRYGIILTKTEQDQIKAFTKAGDAAGAQKVLLDSLTKTTAGAATALKGPYHDALNQLSDVSEDARKALAIGFLPVLEKVGDKLTAALADPKVVDQITNFGRGLAGALDSLIGIAEKLPWGTIGSSLQLAGAGAKIVLEAFTNLPPWVQTAVITGWGLNKLTGGALGGIVGELGKGLIKGVLGMTAGVVNINAGAVNGAGVGAAGAGAAAGGASRLAQAVKVIGSVAIAAGSIAALGEVFFSQRNAIAEQTGAIGENVGKQIDKGASTADLIKSQKALADGLGKLTSIPDFGILTGPAIADVRGQMDAITAELKRRGAADSAALQRAAFAIEHKQQPINVTVVANTTVTVRDTVRKVTTSSRLGYTAQ